MAGPVDELENLDSKEVWFRQRGWRKHPVAIRIGQQQRMLKRRTKNRGVEPTDQVVVYPTFGRRGDGNGLWQIDVTGTVYEAGSVSMRKRMLLRLLQRVAKIQPDESEQPLFESRIREFIAPTERGKRITLKVGNALHHLQQRTKRNGQFGGMLRISGKDLQTVQQSHLSPDGLVNLNVVAADGEPTQFSVRTHLLEAEGISIVSDIDDTIKLTEVHCRRSLLTNTFLREFQTVEGMSSLYQLWAAQGAAFHYVSSSPWQLYAPLAEMCDVSGFPQGSFHLRSFRLRDHMLRRLLLVRRKGKAAVIHSLLKTFPRRKFVLVGDSGESDPEIYGRLTRKRPDQVLAICIRDLHARPLHAERSKKAFRGLPEHLTRIFRCPSELATDLGRLLNGQPVAQ